MKSEAEEAKTPKKVNVRSAADLNSSTDWSDWLIARTTRTLHVIIIIFIKNLPPFFFCIRKFYGRNWIWIIILFFGAGIILYIFSFSLLQIHIDIYLNRFLDILSFIGLKLIFFSYSLHFFSYDIYILFVCILIT